MKTRLFLLLLLLAALPAPSRADVGVPDGKWWKRPRLSAEIGLTPEQQDRIEKIFVRSRSKLIDLRADLQKKQLALQEAMEDKSAARADVEQKIESVENARAELQKTRAMMILDMKQVLTPEQWKKLVIRKEAIEERRQQMRERVREKARADGPNPNR